jgi:uncharacterized membrane protein YphA (DoxX/SURF4 family)
MKANKIVYWISTSIVAVMMIFAAWSYITNNQLKQAFVHLGFPSYFRIELAIAKITGAIILMIPYKMRIKEWAYAGFAIVFTSAFIAHISSGDPVSVYIMPAIFLVILATSYITYEKLQPGIAVSNKRSHIIRSYA